MTTRLRSMLDALAVALMIVAPISTARGGKPGRVDGAHDAAAPRRPQLARRRRTVSLDAGMSPKIVLDRNASGVVCPAHTGGAKGGSTEPLSDKSGFG